MNLEVIAVYYEHPVKTYGVKLTAGVSVVSAFLAGGWTTEALQGLAGLEPPPGLVFSATLATENGGQELGFCLPSADAPRLAGALDKALAQSGGSGALIRPAVLIHLQGPHFGDRYGIASLALAALEEAGIKPLLLAGVVHSLFLALEPQAGSDALTALSRHFSSPG